MFTFGNSLHFIYEATG